MTDKHSARTAHALSFDSQSKPTILILTTCLLEIETDSRDREYKPGGSHLGLMYSDDAIGEVVPTRGPNLHTLNTRHKQDSPGISD